MNDRALLSNGLPVSGGGRPCRVIDRTTGREERGRSPRVATVGDRARVDQAPVRCSGGFDRKRGSPGSRPRACGFPIDAPRSTCADDRMSSILNSRMLSSRASFEARSTIATRDRGSVSGRAGDRPMPGGRRVHQRRDVVARDLEDADRGSSPPSSQPISVRAHRRMPHRDLRRTTALCCRTFCRSAAAADCNVRTRSPDAECRSTRASCTPPAAVRLQRQVRQLRRRHPRRPRCCGVPRHALGRPATMTGGRRS